MKTFLPKRFSLLGTINGPCLRWSFNHIGDSPEIVLYVIDGINVCLSFKLDFPCYNEAECEGMIIRLISILHKRVPRLCVQGDSMLIIKQVKEDFALKGDYTTAI